MLVAGHVGTTECDDMIGARPAFYQAVAVAGERIIETRAAHVFEIGQCVQSGLNRVLLDARNAEIHGYTNIYNLRVFVTISRFLRET